MRSEPVSTCGPSCPAFTGRVQRAGGQVEALHGGLLVGEVAADPHGPPVACIQRLNRIRAANDLADLDVVVQEWHEL